MGAEHMPLSAGNTVPNYDVFIIDLLFALCQYSHMHSREALIFMPLAIKLLTSLVLVP